MTEVNREVGVKSDEKVGVMSMTCDPTPLEHPGTHVDRERFL